MPLAAITPRYTRKKLFAKASEKKVGDLPFTLVACWTFSASWRLQISPLAITGTLTLSFISLMASRLTGSDLWSFVLPWTVRNERPAFSTCWHKSTVFLKVHKIFRKIDEKALSKCFWCNLISGWILILTDTEKSLEEILFFVCSTTSLSSSGLSIRQAPYPSCIAHRCGHPQFRSTPLQLLEDERKLGYSKNFV